MALLAPLRFIAGHPLNRGRRVRALARFAAWQIGCRLVPGPVLVPFVNGTHLVVERGMAGATGNLYCGLHEYEEMAFLLHFLRAGELFVDVGANVGSYTVLAGGGVGARVEAFEPIPATYAHLERNVRSNGLGDLVHTHNVGVSDRRGVLTFVSGEDTVNRVLVDADPGRATIEVAVHTLDEHLGGREPVAMKVDTEGYESAVLAGATATLSSSSLQVLVLELNGAGARYGFDEGAVRRRLADSGFAECRYDPDSRSLSPAPGRKTAMGNTLFVRDLDSARARLEASAPFRLGREL